MSDTGGLAASWEHAVQLRVPARRQVTAALVELRGRAQGLRLLRFLSVPGCPCSIAVSTAGVGFIQSMLVSLIYRARSTFIQHVVVGTGDPA